MRNLTVKARVALANIDELQARRRALEGKIFNVQFYGGWVVIDKRTDSVTDHETFEQALDAAEAANKGERNFH